MRAVISVVRLAANAVMASDALLAISVRVASPLVRAVISVVRLAANAVMASDALLAIAVIDKVRRFCQYRPGYLGGNSVINRDHGSGKGAGCTGGPVVKGGRR